MADDEHLTAALLYLLDEVKAELVRLEIMGEQDSLRYHHWVYVLAKVKADLGVTNGPEPTHNP